VLEDGVGRFRKLQGTKKQWCHIKNKKGVLF